MQNFSMKLDVFYPDESGKYVQDDNGYIWTDGERSPRKLHQCGPNEFTTHNLEPVAGNYRRDGVLFLPDAKKGTVTITGKFPLYCTSTAVPVFPLPCGNFTAVPYSESFADLVRLHHRLRSRDGAAAKERKLFRSRMKNAVMTFHCSRCGTRYEASNFMQAYCSDYCRNKTMKDLNHESKLHYDDRVTERVQRSERWKDIPFQDEIFRYCHAARGAMLHAYLFPENMQKAASIILDRYRRDGYLKILRIDPETGVKVYVHV